MATAGKRLHQSGGSMKKASRKSKGAPAMDLRAEYDFSGGVRGKHYKAYRAGHTVKIHKSDGSTVI
jgi:hypothetical protein